MSLGGPELLVILVVALMVLGPDKLPGVLKTLGKVFGEFKKYQNMAKAEIDKAIAISTSEESTAKPETVKEEKVDEEISETEPIVESKEKVKPILDDDLESK